ncbi:MAG: YaiI/YqxD family protein [Gammaproteobacteria bacterium]|nr:YaiI/YqxD family protein [Gammaproteobacteria bacterium]
MHIWVDADACPRMIRDIILRAAERRAIATTLVANQALSLPPSPYVRSVRVPGGFDEADKHIENSVAPGDLVITADIPLAAGVIAKGALALNPRGTLYSKENIGERLAVRDMLDELRSTRQVRGGPPPLGAQDKQAFANQFDRLLARAGQP